MIGVRRCSVLAKSSRDIMLGVSPSSFIIIVKSEILYLVLIFDLRSGGFLLRQTLGIFHQARYTKGAAPCSPLDCLCSMFVEAVRGRADVAI